MANKEGGGDDYVVESLLQWIDGLGLVKAEIKCDQEPAAVDLVTALVMRCKSTVLIPMASPKGSKGSLGRGERGHLSVQGQLRTIRAATEKNSGITAGATHLLMQWMTRHCSWTNHPIPAEVDRTYSLPQPTWQGLHWRSSAVQRGGPLQGN